MKKTIQDILKDPEISVIDKKIAVEKWKFNELPAWYRKDHKQDIIQKIEMIKKYDQV